NAPPPVATLKVTSAPETGLPLASVTLTLNGLANGCPAMPIWPVPLLIDSFAADPILLPPGRYALTLKFDAERPVTPVLIEKLCDAPEALGAGSVTLFAPNQVAYFAGSSPKVFE